MARADLADPASWPAALACVRKVFLYAHPEGAAQFAAAAREAGVEHVPGPIVERVLQDRGSVPPLPAELATDAVPEILGRPALTFDAWARDHAADFR